MTNKKGQHKASPTFLPEYFNTALVNPLVLNKDERVAQAYPKLPRGRARRLVSFLCLMKSPSTSCVASSCSIGNVSDAAIVANEVLVRYGLQIINYPPKPKILNKFGECSMMHLWELVELEGQE